MLMHMGACIKYTQICVCRALILLANKQSPADGPLASKTDQLIHNSGPVR